MKVVYKISLPIGRIVPGAICVLRGQDEVQVSSRDLQVSRFGELDAGLGQEKRSIRARVDYAKRTVLRGRIGTTRNIRWYLQVAVVPEGMLGRRSHNSQPLQVPINRINLRECLVNVRRCGYQRCTFSYGARSCLPIERISPGIIFVITAASLLQHLEKMDRFLVVSLLPIDFCKKGKAHCVMG